MLQRADKHLVSVGRVLVGSLSGLQGELFYFKLDRPCSFTLHTLENICFCTLYEQFGIKIFPPPPPAPEENDFFYVIK